MDNFNTIVKTWQGTNVNVLYVIFQAKLFTVNTML